MKKIFIVLSFLFLTFQTLWAQVEERPKVYALVNDLRVRKTPDMKGEVITKLALKDSAYYLNMSENTVTVNLRGKDITDAWVEIELMNGQKGWAFGGALVSWYVFPTMPKDAKAKAVVSITEDSYVIKTSNGGTKTLKSDFPAGMSGSEDMKVYIYDKYISGLKSYGFRISFMEGYGYSLVNEENGTENEVAGEPFVSPSKKFVMCLTHVPEAELFTLYKLEGTKMTQLWEQELMSGVTVYEKIEWINDKELKLIGTDFSSDVPAPVSVIFDVNAKKIKF